MEELGKSRVIVRNIESGLGIIIPSRRQYFVLAFLLFWICGWTIGGISTISALLIDNVPLTAQTFMLFWLGGWALGWFFAATTILWQLFGEEVIIVTSGVLTIYRRLIFDFGKKCMLWRTSKTWNTLLILRVHSFKSTPKIHPYLEYRQSASTMVRNQLDLAEGWTMRKCGCCWAL